MAGAQAVAAGSVEPGYTTTEFWTTLLTHVIAGAVAFIALFKHFDTANVQAVVPAVALVAAAIAQAFYSHSRATVKAAAQAVATTPPASSTGSP